MFPFLGIFILLLIVVLVILAWRNSVTQKKTNELSSKIAFSLKDADLMKISFQGSEQLDAIAANFNQVVDKYKTALNENRKLVSRNGQNEILGNQVKNFQDSLIQLKTLSDIGKKITACLTIEEIMEVVYEYIYDSMPIDEMELLVNKNGSQIFYNYNEEQKLKSYEKMSNKDLLMQWTLQNNEAIMLNEAKKDFAQYQNQPITSVSGRNPEALICIPLAIKDKSLGALAVMSDSIHIYDAFHLNYITSIGSYIAVAIDNANVYDLLAENKAVIESEKHKSDQLLLNILPVEVANELKEKGEVMAREFPQAHVMFTDFQGFTSYSNSLNAHEVVKVIDTCFRAFDQIAEKYGLEKIKTMGDAYMAANGLKTTTDNPETDAVAIIGAAIEMQDYIIASMSTNSLSVTPAFKMRVGINSGPIVAGVVGLKKFQFDIWGDTVNTASRMESNGESEKVNISQSTYELVKNSGIFNFEYRGQIEAKGKGLLDMYFVTEKQRA